MNSPFEHTGLDLDAEGIKAWRDYERANRRAARQYRALPSAFRLAPARLWDHPDSGGA